MRHRRSQVGLVVVGLLITGLVLGGTGCNTGGTDPESPLPGTSTLPSITQTTPRVVTPPDPGDARPTTTTQRVGGPGTTAATSAETTTTTEIIRYEVQSGDTLSGIADQYEGVSVEDIVEANGLDNADQIDAGQILIIPPPKSPPTTSPETTTSTS